MRAASCPLCRHSDPGPGDSHGFLESHVTKCCDSWSGSLNLMFSWCKSVPRAYPWPQNSFLHFWWECGGGIGVGGAVRMIGDKTGVAARPRSSRLYGNCSFFSDRLSKHDVQVQASDRNKTGSLLEDFHPRRPETLNFTVLFHRVLLFLAHCALTTVLSS